ncbi:MAG: hypothetical protein PUC65_13320 [Clostridiales bacterium]|nr:hypothetical protein [Clostridiales bacterium]
MNKTLYVMLLFLALLCYQERSARYPISPFEEYYSNLMLQLEGNLTPEKEQMIKVEQQKYQNALEQINRIEALVSNGEIDPIMGDDMKVKWESDLAFYSQFQRVEQQYVYIRQYGGEFIYDTGYLYLLGNRDPVFLKKWLFINLCFIFSFGNVISMEYQKISWGLIGATRKGKEQIIQKKVMISLISSFVLILLLWMVRFLHIAIIYSMKLSFAVINSIPEYQKYVMKFPIAVYVFLFILFQMIVGGLVTLLILLISHWRKNYIQTVFSPCCS